MLACDGGAWDGSRRPRRAALCARRRRAMGLGCGDRGDMTRSRKPADGHAARIFELHRRDGIRALLSARARHRRASLTWHSAKRTSRRPERVCKPPDPPGGRCHSRFTRRRRRARRRGLTRRAMVRRMRLLQPDVPAAPPSHAPAALRPAHAAAALLRPRRGVAAWKCRGCCLQRTARARRVDRR